MKHTRLIGSASSLDELLQMLKTKWFWSHADAVPLTADKYIVVNGNGPVEGMRIIKKKNRYRLEMEVSNV